MRMPYLEGVRSRRDWRRIFIFSGVGFVILLVLFLLTYANYFGPADTHAVTTEFIVKPDTSVFEITKELRAQGFIKSSTAFHIAFARYAGGREILEGGYEISGSQDVWTIAKILSSPPYLAWVTFPPGLRKEQIANILQKKLGWSDEEKEHWIRIDTAPTPALVEGVYFGDTYLIPTDQDPAQVAARLRGRFEDATAEYAADAKRQGIAWTDVLTMASLIEREAAKSDKKLIAGILWNRIDDGMRLQVDATLQYIRGTDENWWPTPSPEDKKIDSAFNTYMYAGLPPHPIASPSLESIDAALNPEKTSCIYYLHDPDGTIHCSAAYAGQIANVNKYLK
ncbi:MAG: Endolytic murein transglycosylase [Parcubacteria group bacterium]|nr:Endolytic murein transglycosylase [Parcubacteria group bacterium]